MCHHRRTVFLCNHFKWGAVMNPCKVEKAFQCGDSDQTCGEMHAHPLHSRRISAECDECLCKRQKTDKTIAEFRLRLRALCIDMEARQSKAARRSIASVSTTASSDHAASESGEEEHEEEHEENEEEPNTTVDNEEELVRDVEAEAETCLGKTDTDSEIPTIDLPKPESTSGGPASVAPVVTLNQDGTISSELMAGHNTRDIDQESF